MIKFNLFLYNNLLLYRFYTKKNLLVKNKLNKKKQYKLKKKLIKLKKKYFKIKIKILKKNKKTIIKKNISFKSKFIKNIKNFILKKKKLNSIFIKITPLINNIYLNIFFKYKKYKVLFYNSLGIINIKGKKQRSSNTSIKLLSLSCKIFLKNFFFKLKKKKFKIKNIFFIFPKKILKVIYYTFLYNIK